MTLKGDANSEPDAEPYRVTEADRLMFSVPWVGYVLSAMSNPVVLFGAGVLAAGVLFAVVSSVRRSGGSRRGGAEAAAGGRRRRDGSADRPRGAARTVAGLLAVALPTLLALQPVQPTMAAFTDLGATVTTTGFVGHRVGQPIDITCSANLLQLTVGTTVHDPRYTYWAQAFTVGTSGTAITNRPKEIIEPLKLMHRLEDFGGFSNVVNYYGGHIQGRWGLADPDEPDPVRLAELNEKMRSVCYVRRTKRDKESPVERISVDIPLSNYEEYNRAERDLVTYLRQTKGFAAATMAERAYILVLLNTLRQITGRGKVKAALEWLDEWFEDSDVEDKLIIFGYHHEVLDALVKWAPQIAAKHRARSVHIIEKMAVNARFATMHVFQSDPTTRVVVCFSGASEGITLTAASSLLTMEFDWNPARHEQKEGRADREGQMADKVLSYYAVAENSIDGDMMERINKKAIVVNAVLDGIIPEENDPGMISAVLEGVMSRHTAAWA